MKKILCFLIVTFYATSAFGLDSVYNASGSSAVYNVAGLSAILTSGADITTGLVGHWKFDDGSGTTATDSGSGGNDGTLKNMEAGDWTTSSKIGPYAIDTDLSDECVAISSMPDVSDGSICFWIYNQGNTGTQYIWDMESPRIYSYIGDSGTQIRFVNFYSSSNSLPLNTWTHVCQTWDSAADEKIIYIDGEYDNNNTASIDYTATPSGTFNISARYGAICTSVNDAIIDDFRFYDRVLSADDVTMLYQYRFCGGGEDYWEGNPGITESFEYKADDFCTMVKSGTDWSIDESGGGTVNTYDSAQYKNGTHSLSVEDDSGAASESGYIRADITSDNNFSVDFWYRTPDNFTGWTNTRRIYVMNAQSSILLLNIYDDAGKKEFRFRANGTFHESTTTVTAATWYRFHVDYNASDVSTCDIYDSNNDFIETLTENSSNAGSVTSIDFGIVSPNTPTSWTATVYFDDLILNTDGD